MRHTWCPACSHLTPARTKLTSRHVFECCPAAQEERIKLGIIVFLTSYRAAGRSAAAAFFDYVNGFQVDGEKVCMDEHLSRGEALLQLTDSWAATWEMQD